MVSLPVKPCSSRTKGARRYASSRVVLLTVNRSVLLQNTVDDIREGGPVSGVSVAGVADIPAVPNAAASSSPSRAQCQTDLPPLAGSDHQHGRPAERADIGPRCTSSRLPDSKRSKPTGGRVLLRPRLGNPAADPWTNLSPPFSTSHSSDINDICYRSPRVARNAYAPSPKHTPFFGNQNMGV